MAGERMRLSNFIKKALDHDFLVRREKLKNRVEKGTELYIDEYKGLEKDIETLQRVLKTLQNMVDPILLKKLEKLVDEIVNSRTIYDIPNYDF